jgi:glutaredoxin
VAQKYGVLRNEGYTERAIFIIDKDGIIRYIDIHNIDDQPNNDVLFTEIERINRETGMAVPTEETSEAAGSQALPHGGVVMYCTSWCPDCKRARAWFIKNGISYTEVDIDKVTGASEQLRKWTGGPLTTPTFDVDGQIIIDFDVEKLNSAIKH